MRFQTPLIPATLLRRYKRFLADIRFPDGSEVTAHCPNPGSMMGLAKEGMRIWVEPNDDPKKKLKFGWRLADVDGGLVVIDTGIANKVVGEALREGAVPGLVGSVRSEVKYGTNSRADFLVTHDAATGPAQTWVEVKSVTLSRTKGLAEFPDSKTARGVKHLGELAAQARDGKRAVMLYLVSRMDCDRFTPAADIDVAYAAAEHDARAAGVEFMVFPVIATPEGVRFDPTPMPLLHA